MATRFRDRSDAGQQLASRLEGLRGERPVVVALPRGGVPVAFEIAAALDAPLEILAVRKLGAPGHPEYGIGAVAEDGTGVVDSAAAARLGVGRVDLDRVLEREARELTRRVARYRGDRAPLPLAGRTVIVVDDGLATGMTDLAAVRAVRRQSPQRVVLAVPVCAAQSAVRLTGEADDVVCLISTESLDGVGRWYEDFSQVGDEEVLSLLAQREGASRDAALRGVSIPADGAMLAGDLRLAEPARGVILFAHGSGSSRRSPRNVQVAETLGAHGFTTLLFDLLTPAEAADRSNVFDIRLLGERLVAATRWTRAQDDLATLPLGYFGASTGAAAALVAAASLHGEVSAVVSRGGRPDLAAGALGRVRAPTLLIVGGEDHQVLELNRRAIAVMRCERQLAVVPGAAHLFEEPGALEEVARLADSWFVTHLAPARAAASEGAA